MNSQPKVCCVVVTYNRKVLLMECLSAIINQTYSVQRIILIDNASTDGTKAALEEQGYLQNPIIDYVLMDTNTGGSGGFYEGIKKAREEDASWIWIMDDDTIPQKDCLEKLLRAEKNIINSSERPIAYLASAVFGMNDEFMNVPTISQKKSENGYPYWYQFLDSGIVNIDDATFVSIMFNKAAVAKCGLPCKDYFIWGDDIEYTRRLSKYYGEGYFVGGSVAIHKRINAKSLSLKTEDNLGRIKMFHYFIRNNNINDRLYNKRKHVRISAVKSILLSLRYLLDKKYGFQKMETVIRGNIESLIQYKAFNRFINNEIKNSIL